MRDNTEETNVSMLSADEAFVALGNETRLQALQVLGSADSALPFTELRRQVGMDDPGQFNYHLNKLKNHFIHQTDDDYALREAGSRVVQAVLSGIVTDAPVLEPTRLDDPCPYCGSPIEIQYREERLLVRCTDCAGTYAGSESDARFLKTAPYGTIALFALPPAGLNSRTPREVLDAALTWTHIELSALASEVCPRCSGTVDWSRRVCENHDTSTGACGKCNRRHAIHIDYDCTNCTRIEQKVPAGLHLVWVPEVTSFISSHGIKPVPTWENASIFVGYEEDVLGMDPFEAQFRYTIDDDEVAVTVAENMSVVDVTK